jgi:hypothetical protein
MAFRQYLAIAVTLGLSAIGLLNILAAALYGEVFLVRGSNGWVAFQDQPVSFLWSLAMSVGCFVGVGGLGVLLLVSARMERRRLDRLSSRPPLEDASRVAERPQPEAPATPAASGKPPHPAGVRS